MVDLLIAAVLLSLSLHVLIGRKSVEMDCLLLLIAALSALGLIASF